MTIFLAAVWLLINVKYLSQSMNYVETCRLTRSESIRNIKSTKVQLKKALTLMSQGLVWQSESCVCLCVLEVKMTQLVWMFGVCGNRKGRNSASPWGRKTVPEPGMWLCPWQPEFVWMFSSEWVYMCVCAKASGGVCVFYTLRKFIDVSGSMRVCVCVCVRACVCVCKWK